MASPLDLLSLIYPGPRESVEDARRDGSLLALHTHPGPENAGVFALIDHPVFVVGYLSFAGDLCDDFILPILNAFKAYLIPGQPREICCNVNGRNPRAIRWIQSLGFRLDMHGLKLAYRGPRLPEPSDPTWRLSGYRVGEAPAYASLFDRAYSPLLKALGSDPNIYTRTMSVFERDLQQREASGGVYAFWIGSRLAAACLVRGSYIRDLAVDPDFQNHGLGSAVLSSVVSDLLSRGEQEIRLDVAIVNEGAQRFYLRHGFKEIGASPTIPSLGLKIHSKINPCCHEKQIISTSFRVIPNGSSEMGIPIKAQGAVSGSSGSLSSCWSARACYLPAGSYLEEAVRMLQQARTPRHPFQPPPGTLPAIRPSSPNPAW